LFYTFTLPGAIERKHGQNEIGHQNVLGIMSVFGINRFIHCRIMAGWRGVPRIHKGKEEPE
jgi:hypothetical protein